jgi:hypothetical protein
MTQTTAAESGGRAFRQAWVDGVHRHFRGNPNPGYVAPWDDMPEWEQQAAASVFAQIQAFIRATDGGAAARLTRQQKGSFVAVCWTGQVLRHIPDPKPSYIADYGDLPDWQRDTDADIFEHVEAFTGTVGAA